MWYPLLLYYFENIGENCFLLLSMIALMIYLHNLSQNIY